MNLGCVELENGRVCKELILSANLRLTVTNERVPCHTLLRLTSALPSIIYMVLTDYNQDLKGGLNVNHCGDYQHAGEKRIGYFPCVY